MKLEHKWAGAYSCVGKALGCFRYDGRLVFLGYPLHSTLSICLVLHQMSKDRNVVGFRDERLVNDRLQINLSGR